MRILAALLFAVSGSLAGPARALDADHAAWTGLLERHVRWNAEGTATTVDYAGFASDRTALRAYLDALSAVPRAHFDRWPQPERTAFLLNAYNAFTVELILTGWPEIASIKDLGSLLRSPWKRRFFVLLGEERHLDDVEHGLLRGAEGFAEPRIHFAVNCASIGCPALRPEAYVGARIAAQLEDQALRFLRDRSRNRFDPGEDTARVSPIFDWYGEDFALGSGDGSVVNFLAARAEALGDTDAERAAIRRGGFDVAWTAYDWRLNGVAAGTHRDGAE